MNDSKQVIEINPNREYFLAGDISGSMSTIDLACGNTSRYKYMLEKFKLFIQTAQDFDEHGAPTILLFGEKVYTFDHMKLEDINSKLNNVGFEGFTNLHLLLDEAFELHRNEKAEMAKEKKFHPGTCLLVFTDGEPTNRVAVERSLAHIVKSIDREDEFQISFLTVGTIDRVLQQWLDDLHDKMEDKNINPRDFDIIHVSRLEDTSFFGAVAANLHQEKIK